LGKKKQDASLSYNLNQSNYSTIYEEWLVKKEKKRIETNLMCSRRILEKKLQIGKIGQRHLLVGVATMVFSLLEDWQ